VQLEVHIHVHSEVYVYTQLRRDVIFKIKLFYVLIYLGIPFAAGFLTRLICQRKATHTSPMSTGTSTRGPITAANATGHFCPFYAGCLDILV